MYTDHCTPEEGAKKQGRVLWTEDFDRVNNYMGCLGKVTLGAPESSYITKGILTLIKVNL